MTWTPNPKPEPRKKKVKKPIRKVSAKEQKRKGEYRIVKDQYLLDHPICEKCLVNHSDQVHHKSGRVGPMLTNSVYFMAVCFGCHRQIEENPKESIENGWSVKRIT